MEIVKVNINDLNEIMKLENNIFKRDSFSREFMKKLINKTLLFYKLVKCKNKQKLLGFIIAIQDDVDRVNIINLLIRKKYQNKGYGSFLLENILEKIKNLNRVRKIILNVNIKNDIAIKLYRKFNFHVIREIQNYYRNQENAYLMELNL